MKKMTSLKEESLFSLEVVVDKLTLPSKVACRFPAVAFRLLDFPTLVIYHVEPELGDSIKTKIRSDPYYKLDNQIHELLDKDGSYKIKKGKSCLLKISPDMLLSHLTSTPLYVMIIDTFPDVPKLIANCTVPLDSVMDVLYGDICKQGLAIPTVRGEKGVYKLYNLMGAQIGGIVLGMRMLSLGVGLIPHLPVAAISKLPKQLKSHDVVTVASKVEKDKIQVQVADIVMEDLEMPKNKPVENRSQLKYPENVAQFQIQTQTDQDILQNMATQTEKRRMDRRSRQQRQGLDIEPTLSEKVIDDIVVTNTVCPPPMFFNSKVENKIAYGLQFFEQLVNKNDNSIDGTEDDWSDNDTIRPEDWRSDSDVDDESKPIEEKKVKKSKKLPMSHNHFHAGSRSISKQSNMKSFPLLNALMTEITALQGTSVGRERSLDPSIHISAPPNYPPYLRTRSPSPSSKLPSHSRSPSPGRERESVEKYINRMASPRHTAREMPSPKTPRKVLPEPKRPLKLHKCQKASKGVPKNRSWIREVPPPMAVQKTKLAYGMTNTQRLRLEKSNPEMLKTLEKQEEERLQKWKEQRQRLEQERLAEGTMGSTDGAKYTIDGHRIRDEIYKKFGTGHKKPVPTPRSHQMDESADYEYDVPSPRRPVPHEKNSSEQIPYLKSDYSWPSSQEVPEKDKNYEKQLKEYYEYEESDADLEYVERERHGNKQKYPDKGFPDTGSITSQGDDREYSNDFESVKQTNCTDTEPYYSPKDHVENYMKTKNVVPIDAGEELGLKKMVDQYSDGESNESFQSAESYNSVNSEIYIENPSSTKISANTRLNTKIDGPKISVATPAVTHIKSGYNRGLIGESGATIGASCDSTAYISRSQVLSQQSYDSNISNDSHGSMKKGIQFVKPLPSPRPRRNTESVSSYNGDDNENVSPRSGISQITPGEGYQGYESESFEEDSDFHMPELKSVDQARLAPEARFAYTLGY